MDHFSEDVLCERSIDAAVRLLGPELTTAIWEDDGDRPSRRRELATSAIHSSAPVRPRVSDSRAWEWIGATGARWMEVKRRSKSQDKVVLQGKVRCASLVVWQPDLIAYIVAILDRTTLVCQVWIRRPLGADPGCCLS